MTEKLKIKLDRRAILIWAVMTALILTLSFVFGQKLWMTLPLCVSLAIGLLQSKVNRITPLIGGLNSILYAVVYFSYGLYATSAYALLVSCPLQLVTFASWRKRPSGNGSSVKLRRLSTKARILIVLGFAVGWVIVYAILSAVGSSYMLLDNTVSLLGILSTVLMMLAYIEYLPLTVLGNFCNVCLYFTMLGENPEQITYLVSSVYTLVCALSGLLYARRQNNSSKIKPDTTPQARQS